MTSHHLVLPLQSFEYDSIFKYEAAPEEKRFKSVYKYEELSNKNNYEADYYKVTVERLIIDVKIFDLHVFSMCPTTLTRPQ